MDTQDFIARLRWYGQQNKIPNITDTNAKFLRDLIWIKGAKNMLEIGTANGFSAIHFGLELQKVGGRLTTIEFCESSYQEALLNIKEVGLDDTVSVIYGDALDEIPKLPGYFDFVFIDAMKRRTVDFLHLTRNKIEPEWIIIIDDVIKFKDKMVWLDAFLQENNIAFNIIPIDGCDGIMMIRHNGKITSMKK